MSQVGENGKVYIIAYASQTLRPSEKFIHIYSSAKLELFALKWTVTNKCRHYLLGQNLLFILIIIPWHMCKQVS